MGDPERAAASGARLWLTRVLQSDAPDHCGRWQHAYAELARKPELERAAAAATLTRVASQPGQRRYLTPQHILDYWRDYVAGNPPGRSQARVASAVGGRLAGMAAVGRASDFQNEKGKPDPW
jgi:hypothetical protein